MSLSDKLNFKTLEWSGDHLRILDQTRLPQEMVYLECDTVDEVASAIKELKVRGAPAIGIAAAFGVVVGLRNQNLSNWKEFEDKLSQVISTLASTRPTAVNLFWALERMRRVAEKHKNEDIQKIGELLLEEAISIHEEDKLMCEKIGEFGANLLKDGDTVLTHCNAGALATGGIGTALGIIYTASWQGKKISVFSDETRPVLQGARLTVWELQRQGIEVTLICDNTAAFVMKNKKIDCVIVGADRIAANGDVANKIGTYNVAVLAHHHKIPFYVAAPTSTVDPDCANGDLVPIEERSPDEVLYSYGLLDNGEMGRVRLAPKQSTARNIAFDVTPARYITSIITQRGIFKPENIVDALK